MWLRVVRISCGQKGKECLSRPASGILRSRGIWSKEKLEILDDPRVPQPAQPVYGCRFPEGGGAPSGGPVKAVRVTLVTSLSAPIPCPGDKVPQFPGPQGEPFSQNPK